MTDDFGELMRDAASAAAARSARPPAAHLRKRLARRRATTTAGVATVVALAVAATAGAWETRASLEPAAPPTSSPSPSPVASHTPTPPPPSRPEAPTTIVAGTPGGPIVLLSATTGAVVRTLEGTSGWPQVSPDRQTVYFSRDVSDCESEVVSVPTWGGPMTVLTTVEDTTWQVSPDGSRIAYYEQNGPCHGPETDLVVKDLRTGTERRWSAGPGAEYGVRALAWAPDSTHVAVIRDTPRAPHEVQHGAGSAGYAWHTLWILDVRAPGTTLDAARRVPRIKGLYGDVSYHGPDGTLYVVAVPSHLDMPSILYEVDPDSGRTREVVEFPHPVTDYDFDASGEHVIYTWDGTLHRLVDGRSTRIAGNVTLADW